MLRTSCPRCTSKQRTGATAPKCSPLRTLRACCASCSDPFRCVGGQLIPLQQITHDVTPLLRQLTKNIRSVQGHNLLPQIMKPKSSMPFFMSHSSDASRSKSGVFLYIMYWHISKACALGKHAPAGAEHGCAARGAKQRREDALCCGGRAGGANEQLYMAGVPLADTVPSAPLCAPSSSHIL